MQAGWTWQGPCASDTGGQGLTSSITSLLHLSRLACRRQGNRQSHRTAQGRRPEKEFMDVLACVEARGAQLAEQLATLAMVCRQPREA